MGQGKEKTEWKEKALKKRDGKTHGKGQEEATVNYQNSLLIRSEYFHQTATCGRCSWERTAGCWFSFLPLREAAELLVQGVRKPATPLSQFPSNL